MGSPADPVTAGRAAKRSNKLAGRKGFPIISGSSGAGLGFGSSRVRSRVHGFDPPDLVAGFGPAPLGFFAPMQAIYHVLFLCQVFALK
jgi:hypothetical protein